MMPRWRALLDERLTEATALLGSVPGVHGLVVGGSVGRGEPWPMSDIDLLPIRSAEAADEVERRRAALVDWWAASGRAQTLDVGWLAFTPDEVEQAVTEGAPGAARRMHDRRWLHGLDKAYGGYGVGERPALAQELAAWATAVRFDPAVTAARLTEWRRQTLDTRQRAEAARQSGDAIGATLALQESARAVRLILIEGWGERLGSMGREWTRFERMAERHDASELARRIAHLAAAGPEQMPPTEALPLWLQERIERSYAARLEIGEAVSEAESARDQITAFRIHVSRHRPDLSGEWLGVPDPDLATQLTELDGLLSEVCTPTG